MAPQDDVPRPPRPPAPKPKARPSATETTGDQDTAAPESTAEVDAPPVSAPALNFREELARRLSKRGSIDSLPDPSPPPTQEAPEVTSSPPQEAGDVRLMQPEPLDASTASSRAAARRETPPKKETPPNTPPRLPPGSAVELNATSTKPPQAKPVAPLVQQSGAPQKTLAAVPSDGGAYTKCSSGGSSPRSTLGNDVQLDELLYRPPDGFGPGQPMGKTNSNASGRGAASAPQPIYSAWRRKNIEDELQLAQNELREARQHSSRVEEDLRRTQAENSKLRQQLDLQRERDDLLRDLNGVSEERNPHASYGGSGSSGRHSETVPERGRVCGSVCSIFGRNR